jgi:glycosyltransferase involved in cell wall biosynthesis
MPIRVAFATNIISPYRVPLYAALGRTPNWEFELLSCCEMEFDRQWTPISDPPFAHKKSFSFSYTRLSKHSGRVGFTNRSQVHIPLGLWFDLWRFRPDVVISGEMGARSLIAGIYALIARKSFVVWSYGTLHSERDITWKQRRLRRVILRMAHAVVGMGSEARRYFQSLGIRGEVVFDAPNAIDSSFLPPDLSSEKRSAIRGQLGISGLCYLYVGKFIAGKGMNELLDAWEIFAKCQDVQVSLVLVGDGNQKESLERRVTERGVRGVRFVPFVQLDELPTIYHAADVLVFPTLQDVWGLVVNEAMTFGLPVICSKYAGCASDLIIEDRNGWLVDPKNREDLVRTLRKAWDARDKNEAMAKTGQGLIACLSIQNMAEGFRRAVEYAQSRSKLRSENAELFSPHKPASDDLGEPG